MADPTLLAALRTSPLAHLAPALRASEAGSVLLRELPFRTMVNLRVAPGGVEASRVEAALGLALPRACGATGSSSDGGRSALWLGPDEWLVVAEPEGTGGPELVVLLDAALAGAPGSAVDVSANRTTLELVGDDARAVLATGCALDLHPRVFGPGRAVSTAVGPVPVVLWQTGPVSYRLMPRASFADYLARWLLDALPEP